MGWYNTGGWQSRGWGNIATGGGGGGGATVTRDAVGAFANTTGTTFSYTGLVTGASANGVIAFVTMENRTMAHVSSVTIDGSTMTLIGSVALISADTTTGVFAAIVTPSASTRTIAVTADVSDSIHVGAISFNNVNSAIGVAFSVPAGWTPSNPIPGDGATHASLSITSTLGTGHMAAFFGRASISQASSITLSPAAIAADTASEQAAMTTSSTSGTYTATPNVSSVMCAIAVDISP